MKLYLNAASPYARLVRVLLAETGRVEETVLVYTDPWALSQDLLAANPAGKVPALELENGRVLTESTVIADHLIRGGAFDPRAHDDWEARLRILGLARAAMDCAFGSVVEARFSAESPLIERWRGAVPRIARAVNAFLDSRASGAPPCLADLTLAVAFEYVDFRLKDLDWRGENGALESHVAALVERSSLLGTRPE